MGDKGTPRVAPTWIVGRNILGLMMDRDMSNIEAAELAKPFLKNNRLVPIKFKNGFTGAAISGWIGKPEGGSINPFFLDAFASVFEIDGRQILTTVLQFSAETESKLPSVKSLEF